MSVNPPKIPPNYVQNDKGEWCHPSRVTKAMNNATECLKPQKLSYKASAKFGKGRLFYGPIMNPAKRIRQSTKPLMNKLEAKFHAYMFDFYPSCFFHVQSIRFRLGNGIWYKPDLVCFDWEWLGQRRIGCWEVKGPFAHRGGFENLKVAASKYPQIIWALVWEEKGRWQQQIVLP